MPSKISSKLTKEERLIRSLSTAAKTLNKVMHQPLDGKDLEAAKHDVKSLVRVFQVYCPKEKIVIGRPTTDEDSARELRDEHNLVSGHNSRVLVSNN